MRSIHSLFWFGRIFGANSFFPPGPSPLQAENPGEFWEDWWHVLAPTSLQSARIALKTSLIESYEFSTSKLCTNFFSNSNEKIFFFGIKKKIWKYFHPKIFSSFFWSSEKNKISFFEKVTYFFFGHFFGKIFLGENIFRFFFDPEKKYFFVGVGKKLGT